MRMTVTEGPLSSYDEEAQEERFEVDLHMYLDRKTTTVLALAAVQWLAQTDPDTDFEFDIRGAVAGVESDHARAFVEALRKAGVRK